MCSANRFRLPDPRGSSFSQRPIIARSPFALLRPVAGGRNAPDPGGQYQLYVNNAAFGPFRICVRSSICLSCLPP